MNSREDLISGLMTKSVGTRNKLTAQLSRQLMVEREYGIKAHEISKIRLIPVGRKNESITYSSLVTLKNGNEIEVPNINIKKLLDTGVE